MADRAGGNRFDEVLGLGFRFSPDAMLLLDPRGVIAACNQAAEDLLGCPSTELIGRPARQVFGAPLPRHQGYSAAELDFLSADGRLRRLDVTRVTLPPGAIPTESPRSFSLAVVRDATFGSERRRRLEEKVRHLAELAHTDALTGLGNRFRLQEERRRLAGASHRGAASAPASAPASASASAPASAPATASASAPATASAAASAAGQPASAPAAGPGPNGKEPPDAAQSTVAMLDVDNMKSINDGLGHHVGDRVLQEIGGLLQRHTRQSDVAIRYGGDEFVLLLPHTTLTQAQRLMRRLEKMMRGLGEFLEMPVNVSVSYGLAEVGEGEPLEDALVRADRAMYTRKRRRRRQPWTPSKDNSTITG